MDRSEASSYAIQDIRRLANIDQIVELSKAPGISKITIDFKLNVDVVVKRDCALEKKDMIELVEDIPKISPVKNVLEKYDLSFVVFKDGAIKFKRTKYYRPLVNKKLH